MTDGHQEGGVPETVHGVGGLARSSGPTGPRDLPGLISQLCGDPSHDAPPVARRSLPEQAQAGVPGTVVARDHPAPVGRGLQQHPGRPAECTGEMRHCSVDTDHEVERRDRRGGLVEIAQLAGEVDDRAGRRQYAEVGGARRKLQAEKGTVGSGEQRREQVRGAIARARTGVVGIAAPSEPDRAPGAGAEPSRSRQRSMRCGCTAT